MSLQRLANVSISAGAAALALLALGAPGAAAADAPCDGLSELPCGLPIPDVAVQRVPAVFQLQARVGQAKLPLGDTTFQTVLIQLIGPAPEGGTEILCAESVDGVEVRGGLLNVTMGQHMDCELDEVLAENDNLAFQLCLGGPSGCLQPIELASTPYAVKATYAHLARQASHAHLAARASYAHRATADREHFLRDQLGAGYFDFYTHAAADAEALLAAEGAGDNYEAGAGYLQWTPIRGPASRTLHLAGRSEGPRAHDDPDEEDYPAGALEVLDAVVLMATRTDVYGDLTVGAGDGLRVEQGSATVTGDSDVTGALEVAGSLVAMATAAITGSATVGGDITVGEGLTVLAGGLQVAGAFTLDAGLLVTGGLAAAAGLTAAGAVEVLGLLTAGAATFTPGLDVAGEADLAALEVEALSAGGTLATNGATLAGDAGVAGDLTLTGALEVDGDAALAGSVVFEAGFTAPEAAPDLRYVLAAGEDRDLGFGGAVQIDGGLTAAGGLDLQGNRLLGARLPVLGGPPPACEAPTEGYLYLDAAAQKAWVCVGGEYRQLGGYDCGNGFVQPHEQCDDGDQEPGDGCDATCRLEPGPWTCTPIGVQPTVCGYCGDGVVTAALGETCDDGAAEPGDGCDATCELEPPWDCWGEPSTCYQHGSVVVAWEFNSYCPLGYDHTTTIPAGVPVVTVEVWGGQGGLCNNGTDYGGYGGYVKGDIDLTAAGGPTTLWSRVGTKGGCPGYGYGPFSNGMGHGGGYSMVGFAQGEHFLVAGAGGACGGGPPSLDGVWWGGAGGYPSGTTGATGCGGTGGGGGGTQTSGGPLGVTPGSCNSGAAAYGGYLQGGSTGSTSGCSTPGAPGGGGGGYYGGGGAAASHGGCAGAGGGGSSWYDPDVVTAFEHETGVRYGHGHVVLTW